MKNRSLLFTQPNTPNVVTLEFLMFWQCTIIYAVWGAVFLLS